MNFIFRFIAIAVMVAPVSAFANSWSCTNNKLIRTVSIESEEGSTACKVNYTKETEGVPMNTLWNAANDAAYCTEKAEGFVAKLTSWGWACTKAAEAVEPMAEPMTKSMEEPMGKPMEKPMAAPAKP